MIKARFIGETSCGFVSGNLYSIIIKTIGNYIWVLDSKSNANCPYSGIQQLSDNWKTV